MLEAATSQTLISATSKQTVKAEDCLIDQGINYFNKAQTQSTLEEHMQ